MIVSERALLCWRRCNFKRKRSRYPKLCQSFPCSSVLPFHKLFYCEVQFNFFFFATQLFLQYWNRCPVCLLKVWADFPLAARGAHSEAACLTVMLEVTAEDAHLIAPTTSQLLFVAVTQSNYISSHTCKWSIRVREHFQHFSHQTCFACRDVVLQRCLCWYKIRSGWLVSQTWQDIAFWSPILW